MQLSTVQTTGHVTKDLVLRTGSNGKTKYLRLNLAVDTGYGENKKTVFYQATFYDKEAERLVKATVKKGSFITLAGNIEDVIVFQPDGSEEIMSMISILHDVARVNEFVDGQHGFAAVEAIHQRGLRLKGMRLSQKEYRIAEKIICYHCRDDQEGIAAIQAMAGLSRKDKERAVRLYHIAKDMDGLDRVRFNGLDYRMLRTPFAARLPLIAGYLLKENILLYVQSEQ